MAEGLTADEILQVAMEIEETGRVFYEAMGAASLNEKIDELCRRLALAEKEHYERFRAMRAHLVRHAERALTDGEKEFIHGMVANRIMPSLREALAAVHQSSPAHLLDLAGALEQDSITFYSRLHPMIAPDDATALELILEEEKRHLLELKLARRHLV